MAAPRRPLQKITIADGNGAEAPIEAALRADAMLDKGDLDGQRVWLRILAAINELMDTQPGHGTAAH